MKNHEINNAEVSKMHSSECTEGENGCYVVIVLTSIPFLLLYDEGSVIVENDSIAFRIMC